MKIHAEIAIRVAAEIIAAERRKLHLFRKGEE
jgi:hypothetical protein